MKIKFITTAGILSTLISLSACTEPGETTTIGAATGGVIGAGLGAIVGNQTGNPGSGLVIGSIAGAGAGAAIGNVLEGQQKAIRTQDEALERQQKMLAAQNTEIRELRNMPQDASTALRGAMREEASLANRRINSAPATTGRAVTTDDLNRGASVNPSRPSLGTTQVGSLNQIDSPRAAFRPQALQERTIEAAPVAIQAEPAPVVLAKRVENPSGLKSAECEKADTEADKASSSKEPADKLFYLRRAIRLCPTYAGFHKQLADEYSQLGRNEDAKASYEDAIKLDPAMSEAKKSIAALSENAY